MKTVIEAINRYLTELGFIFLTFCFYLLAINTQIGWFFLITALMLALMFISYRNARHQLENLQASRILPPSAFEDEEIEVRLLFDNQSSKNRHLIQVEDDFSARIFKRPLTLILKELAGHSQALLIYRGQPELRGVYSGDALKLTTAFPFGLWTKSRSFSPPGELVVYPKALPLQLPASWGADFSYLISSGGKNFPGKSGDFLSVREHLPMEDTRFIHWKTSAHRGRLMVQEFTTPSSSPMAVIIHNYRQLSAGEGKLNSLEYGVKAAASLAQTVIGYYGSVDLLSCYDKEIISGSFSNRFSALDFLARLKNNGNLPLREMLKQSRLNLNIERHLVIISPQPAELSEFTRLLRKNNLYILLLKTTEFTDTPPAGLPTEKDYLDCAEKLTGWGIRVQLITPRSNLKTELENLLKARPR